jgi:hypothetical protein
VGEEVIRFSSEVIDVNSLQSIALFERQRNAANLEIFQAWHGDVGRLVSNLSKLAQFT